MAAQRRRVVAAASSRAPSRAPCEKMSGRSSLSISGDPAAPRLQRPVGQRAAARLRRGQQERGAGTTSSTSPALSARARLEGAAGEDQVERARPGRPGAAGAACRPAPGMRPSFTSGRPSDVFGIVATPRGSGRPAPSPGRRPGRSRGSRPPRAPAALPAGRARPGPARERLALERAADGREVLDVGARDEVVGLAAAQHDRAHVRARLELAEQRLAAPASSPCPAC